MASVTSTLSRSNPQSTSSSSLVRSSATSSWTSSSSSKAVVSSSSSAVASGGPSGSSGSGSNAVWVPARNPDVDRNSPERFVPANVLALYYVERSPGARSKLDTATLASGSRGILLEDISTVDTVTCSGSTITITFISAAAASAAQSWPAGTLLFTSADGCNNGNERGVYRVNNQITKRSLDRRISIDQLLQFAVTIQQLQDIIASLTELIKTLTATPIPSLSPSPTTVIESSFDNILSSTPTPKASSKPAPVSPPTVIDSSCAPLPAPAGSTCFTLTGHGAPQIEGQLLSLMNGYGNPRFSSYEGYTPGTFYIDSSGFVGIASSAMNGCFFANGPDETDTPWLSLAPLSAIQNYGYVRTVCSLASDGQLKCNIFNNLYTTWTSHAQFDPSDTRSLNALWGEIRDFVPLTITYNLVPCTPACPAVSSSSIQNTSTPTPQVAPVSIKPTPVSSPVTVPSAPQSTPKALCGGLTNGLFTNSDGSTWNLYCGRKGAAPMSSYSSLYMLAITHCFSYCIAIRGCVGVHWDETNMRGTDTQCTPYSILGLPDMAIPAIPGTFDVAYLVSGPQSSSPVINKPVRTSSSSSSAAVVTPIIETTSSPLPYARNPNAS
ncbi:hypothetical protein T440DRAFT_152147 [Plenodomus tracheiphilus IPT5]|uniref:DUF7029 domain-containing protein n=1 Tax=Plenodomus tracheiphilus IPT5 TaxID=1408161 RepID=A0A6A7B217_9PLEO|nr:hypothetical protein T440DRAFT_152147 [Plenodomus tracheiphilus IPT5]